MYIFFHFYFLFVLFSVYYWRTIIMIYIHCVFDIHCFINYLTFIPLPRYPRFCNEVPRCTMRLPQNNYFHWKWNVFISYFPQENYVILGNPEVNLFQNVPHKGQGVLVTWYAGKLHYTYYKITTANGIWH